MFKTKLLVNLISNQMLRVEFMLMVASMSLRDESLLCSFLYGNNQVPISIVQSVN